MTALTTLTSPVITLEQHCDYKALHDVTGFVNCRAAFVICLQVMRSLWTFCKILSEAIVSLLYGIYDKKLSVWPADHRYGIIFLIRGHTCDHVCLIQTLSWIFMLASDANWRQHWMVYSIKHCVWIRMNVHYNHTADWVLPCRLGKVAALNSITQKQHWTIYIVAFDRLAHTTVQYITQNVWNYIVRQSSSCVYTRAQSTQATEPAPK